MVNEIKDILEYIEKQLFEEINVNKLAKKFSYSESGFRLLFKSNFNISLNEYIRKRRLTQIAFKIQQEKLSITEYSEQLYYKNTESFLKAFKKFHNTTPSQVSKGAKFKCLNKLDVKLFIDGGDYMGCEIKKIGKLLLTGYKTKMTGDVLNRFDQEADFFENTREKQDILFNISKNLPHERKIYTFSNNIYEDGFDFYIAYDCGGLCPEGFDLIEIPAGEYYSFETERCRRPVGKLKAVWSTVEKEIKGIGLPVVEIYHWYLPDSKQRDERYIETLIKKKDII